METVSQREFSRRLGVSEASVRKAITNGWIVQGCTTRPNGMPAILYETALQEWNASPAGIQAATRQGTKPEPVTKTKTAAPTNNTTEAATPPSNKALLFDPEAAAAKKKILENKQNSSNIETQRRALELHRMLGKLVDKDKVYDALYEFGKGLRDNLSTVPDRYIDEIRNADSRHKAHEILSNGITEALRLLSTPPDLANTH